MNMISLSIWDLLATSSLILILAAISFKQQFNLHKQLIIAAIRATIQLFLIGFILRWLFGDINPVWLVVVAGIMLLAAGREVIGRQQRPFAGGFGYLSSVLSMFLSSFILVTATLSIIIKPDPWFSPQYAIPLLGMLLGNTMNGISISMDRLTSTAWQQQQVIEQRLMLGESSAQALADIKKEAMRAGMIPSINGMASAGIVALPGMMTGQILAGSPPLEAVKYQLLILFLISAGSGFGVYASLELGSRRLFDQRHRLRLERLKSAP
ncbi:ABC transporter permease [Alkalimarinus coralli]|uniref:ABC transporter permease n=1 Tax=Alkalimarinus coralli TaxID=2935863 RepID=UPI00202B82FB|nr:iron export ABC transporter permease subunit FetB [Alkalimarinus coralli]